MSDTEKRIAEFTRHSYGTWRRQELWKKPLHIKDAEGVHMVDDQGKRYLDFSSQLMCSNLGHKNKAVIEAIVKQAERLPYVAPGFITDSSMEAVEALLTILPKGLAGKIFFSTSGTEANEAALKILRQRMSPAYKVISRYHSYHGATSASVTFTGDPRRWYAEQARCTVEGVRFAPDAYCYRCPFGLEYGKCNIQCARYVEYMIKEEGNVAAVIVEPVVGTNGRIVPPPEYFPLLRKICDEQGVLLVTDEVMSGWFRTGKAFAVENWGVTPDILTTAKGSTAAYTPVGITVTSDKVAEFFDQQIMSHGHTYAYHALALSAIPPSVAEYKKLMASGLPQRASGHLKKRLHELAERHESIGDARGIGHFWALELVKNRKTKELFNLKADEYTRPLMTARVAGEALKNGVYVAAWYDTLIVAPPLIITEAQIDEGIDALDKALKLADEQTTNTGISASRSSEYGS
ncbi:MAG: aminotransferase class III-fold pyridoxal phosphate-dependent enzyme [Spirochaetales bacterium]|nr:aminotransferase class III-fold pyridoxal phosphate-dependent enzyme [Spirochaetales bacterium]